MNGKHGRPRFVEQLPAGLRERLHALLDCGRSRRVARVYRALGLDVYCTLRSLQGYAARRRERMARYECARGLLLREAARDMRVDLDSVHPRPRWWQDSSTFRASLERALREVDYGAESSAAIYRRWNLVRFVGPRAWRAFVRSRRQGADAPGGMTSLPERHGCTRPAAFSTSAPIPSELAV
jgi:hypothetical protein